MKKNNINWVEYNKLKDGTKIELMKFNSVVSFGFKRRGVWQEIFRLSEAAPGEGVMDWSEFKERTYIM